MATMVVAGRLLKLALAAVVHDSDKGGIWLNSIQGI